MSYLFMFIANVTDDILFSLGNIQTYKGERVKSALVRVANRMVFFFVVANIPKDNNYVILLIAIASGVGRYISFVVDDVMTKDERWLTIVKYPFAINGIKYAIDQLKLADIPVFSVKTGNTDIEGNGVLLFIINDSKKSSKIIEDAMPNGAIISSIPPNKYK